MHVDAPDRKARKRAGPGVDFAGAGDRHAELVLRLAGRNLGVGLRVDVGVDADGDRSERAAGGGDGRERLEFRLRLDVEAEDFFVEPEVHLRLRLADAGKDDPLAWHGRRPRSPEFPLADHVHAGPEPGEGSQDRLVGIGLHRVEDQSVLTGEGGAKHIEVPLDGGARIAIERRADGASNLGQRHVFGAKHAVAIAEMMHR